MRPTKTARLSSDKTLGAVGGSLAVASLGFGIYMNTHGPAPGSFGASGNFTVFAQLAPHKRARPAPASPPATAAPTDDALDMTATASIPKRMPAPAEALPEEGSDAKPAEAPIITSVTLEAIDIDSATIAIGGRARRVHVGDIVPGAGEILEIQPSPRPMLKTSGGLIVSARGE